MNAKNLLQIKAALQQFHQTHPKVLPFMKAVEADGLRPGTVIEITVTTPEGTKRSANIQLQQSDIDLLNMAKGANMGGF
ncbi:MAG: hypothetical protein HFH53_09835 [Hespellia sp.]|nr:hypothetical protein [Hespellia sp.]